MMLSRLWPNPAVWAAFTYTPWESGPRCACRATMAASWEGRQPAPQIPAMPHISGPPRRQELFRARPVRRAVDIDAVGRVHQVAAHLGPIQAVRGHHDVAPRDIDRAFPVERWRQRLPPGDRAHSPRAQLEAPVGILEVHPMRVVLRGHGEDRHDRVRLAGGQEVDTGVDGSGRT